MSETYIRTTIVSRARQARALNWLERPLWAEPGVAYTVPYEPLSRLKPATRDTVLAEVAKGRLELTLEVRHGDETVTVPYGPIPAVARKHKETAPVATTPVVQTPVATTPDTREQSPSDEPEAVTHTEPLASVRDTFNAHVAAKEWTAALNCLKEHFGDKVTFGARALQNGRDYDAVVARYGLED